MSIVVVQAGDPVIKEGNGLTGHYYQSYTIDTAGVISFDGMTELFARIDTIIDFWDGNSTYSWGAVASSQFSVWWKGYIYIEVTNQYGFGTISDDGSQIFIDSVMIVDNGEQQWYDWEDNMGESDTSNTPFTPLILDSGLHTIDVRFYEDRTYEGIELWWFKAGNDTSDIPYYGDNFGGVHPTYNPQTNWQIVPKSVLYTSLDSVTAIDMNEQPGAIPGEITLSQNYPNPFNSSTMINYQLPKSSFVILTVYNVLGQAVTQLVSENKPAGNHWILFDAKDLASGVYFYKLQVGQYSIKVRKMILLQ